MINDIIGDAEDRMQKSIASLEDSFKKFAQGEHTQVFWTP